LVRKQTHCPSPLCVQDFTWAIQVFVAWFDILFAVTGGDFLKNNRRRFKRLIGTVSTSFIEFSLQNLIVLFDSLSSCIFTFRYPSFLLKPLSIVVLHCLLLVSLHFTAEHLDVLLAMNHRSSGLRVVAVCTECNVYGPGLESRTYTSFPSFALDFL
jgi:hypothetical protein